MNPSDAEIVAVMAASSGKPAAVVSRRPYAYATSARLEEVGVDVDGASCTVIVKHLRRTGLLDAARSSKPPWVYDPRREPAAYAIVGPAGVGPRCHGAAATWLVIDKVDGVELWQVGDFAVWESVASWLADFHRRFADAADDLTAAHPALLRIDAAWFTAWAERAATTLAASGDSRADRLARVLAGYDDVAAALAAEPRRLVHGELYPSNVMVRADERSVAVVPVDWEMAGVGPAAIDLAALVTGWDEPRRDALVAAYGAPGLGRAVHLARLHLAVQWIGWADGWAAPPEHAHDWIGEALDAATAAGVA